jgi:two-component sensor histidine kinase
LWVLERLAFVLPVTKAKWWEQVLLAGASTGLALAVRLAIDPLVHGDITYIAFVPSVLLSAVIGGRLAGSSAALAGGLAANWFFVGDAHRFDLSIPHLWALVFAWVACALLILMGDRLAVGLRREAALNRRLDLAARELEHRIKNLITVAQAVVNQSARPDQTPREMKESIGERLQAVGRAQSLILRSPGKPLELADLVAVVLKPFPKGPSLHPCPGSVLVSPSVATGLALILNELATNATKYGCLSVEGGAVCLSCLATEQGHVLTWEERGGPKVTKPQRRGFGSTLFKRALDSTEGTVDVCFEEQGLRCDINLNA